ncbi:DUF4411 family protein [Rhodoferax sp. BLA1]|uniref:DUF4411 family protein n=1 Tax=Rhodoferax sp. BLA1 TaxID=2576062 RepID=UPI0015D40DF4|nr:DUF4411 family protein [Rhodoferax sp. BLA1]
MIYLLDSNTLIEAKNRYYGMTICPGYWSWVLRSHGQGVLASIKTVGDELKLGNDELALWTRRNAALFLPVSDADTQAAFVQVAAYVASQTALMKAGALEEFLGGADPWLIAKAMALPDSVVVTHEQFNLQMRRKFSIPNVCQHFGVQWMDTFAVLGQTKANFVLVDA